MPAAHWETYRLGARIPSLDGIIGSDANQIDRLPRALSAVACIEPPGLPIALPPATEDARFVGRLLLGLLGRGWPTLASPDVERSLLDSVDPAAGLTERATGPDGHVGWRLDPDASTPPGAWEDAIRGALLRGDRRLVIDEAVLETLTDSRSEQAFYRDYLAPLLGNAIGWLELQRPLASMVREDAPGAERVGSGRVDFALDLPGTTGPIHFVIELDGPHHDEPAQSVIDANRDRLLGKHDWETSRVPVGTLEGGELNYLPGKLRAIIKGNPFPFTHIEADERTLDDPRNREAVRLVLTPHAVARVQLALSRALMDGALALSASEWTVAVVERDVPCAEVAVRDWLHALHHLGRLYGMSVAVERVRILVAEDHLAPFPALPWRDRPGMPTRTTVEPLAAVDTVLRIDLAVDVSVGAHPTRCYPTDPLAAPNLLIRRRTALRTAQRQSGYTVEPWPEPRPIADPLKEQASLDYFLEVLFRKRAFREGQLPIVERVLRRQDVIGLLPTGAGKSITFQLPALLSPGLSLVIDPIKSLMQDQVENLAAAGVMDAIQINSDTPKADRAKIDWQFGQGEYRLVFVSPERMQIRAFRDLLTTTAHKRPIAYVVVDEAHCVSEWGHDFRTAYLNLGRIATEYCGRGGVRPPVVALTGTASESVLRDVQRELAVEGEDAIVRPAAFARDELRFEIVKVQRGRKASELVRLINSDIPNALGVEPNVLASSASGGIVFCPHVNGGLGVVRVAARTRNMLPLFRAGTSPASKPASNLSGATGCPDGERIGFYCGEMPKIFKKAGMSNAVFAACKERTQRAFKVGNMPLLVATSAFGMGIDKPNIRYTVHYAMAKSVEAFAQEAGRAGRDREDAICAVLFTDRLLRSKEDATAAIPDCLERGITVEEARLRAAAAGQNGSDDAEMQMYLYSRSYQGVKRESAAVRAFYHQWIEPHLPAAGGRICEMVEVTVSEEDYRRSIETLMVPLIEVDVASDEQTTSSPIPDGTGDGDDVRDENALPHPDLQRVIYRLSLVGIIDDYTVDYRWENNVYSLTVRADDAQAIVEHLYRYVARYRTSERQREVESYLAASSLENAACRSIDTLCWFIYQEVEQRRREGMATMRELLRESTDGADFGRRLNEMLSNTALTQTVFDVLRADDYREWRRIADEIGAAESAERVYYQCQRALEDAPGHPGLLLLLGLALQGVDGARRDEVVDYLREGLRQARLGFSRNDQRGIADWVVPELARIAPASAPAVLDRVVRRTADPVLAGAVLRAVDGGTLAPDPILLRTSRRSLLHSIDDRIGAYLAG